MSYEDSVRERAKWKGEVALFTFIYDESLARFHESTTPRSVKACSFGHEGRVGRPTEKL